MPPVSPLEWLDAAQGRGIMPGLERMERLLAALGNPEKNLRCLHVAGTNGKGSVCAFTESILRKGGLRTGLYTSPHLVDFEERIRIGGEMIGTAVLEGGIQRLRTATERWAEEEKPTFFELVTALAFDCFACADCEVVVLETGLGGRLDATNTASKLACAITPIARDHTEWLGDTLGEIAREKAGIFRPGIPAVIAPQEPEAASALVTVAQEIGTSWEFIGAPLEGLPLGLSGTHQRWNAALAAALVRAGGFRFSDEVMSGGLREAVWPGRFQRLREGHLILDGAHNPHAVRQLLATWREEFGERKCRLIFGALGDKDPEALLAELSPLASEILLVPVASPRSADPALLAEKTADFGIPTRVFASLAEALGELFKQGAASEPPVLLAGSLFLVGEALALEAGTGVLPRSQ